MLNTESLTQAAAARWTAQFFRPRYDRYAFAQIPQTVFHALTGKGAPGMPDGAFGALGRRYRKVILLLLDGFGWRFFERYVEHAPFLRRFVERGVASKISTQFPSTTAAHVTTIHTGLPVGESGVYEWFYYEPQLDRVIAPLLYSFAGDKVRDTLQTTGIAADALYPNVTLYQRLRAEGVKSYVFQHREYTPSTYSTAVQQGARVVPYKSWSEALVNLIMAAADAPGPAYYFSYFDAIDSVGHFYGPTSRQFEAEAQVCMMTLDYLFNEAALGGLKDTLLLVTADHGQVEMLPGNTFYLNRRLPWLTPLLRATRLGEPIVPAGSARDMFLYVRDEALDEVQGRLAEILAGQADVVRTEGLLAQGFFGATIGDSLRGRLGNLVILPYEKQGVWWFERERFEQRYLGHHGGLTPQECETIFLALACG